MSNHPLNLGVRFLLELAMIAIFAYWAWNTFDGISKYVLSIVVPLLGSLLWAIFKVEGDGAKPLVAVNGVIRLSIECLLFSAAFLMLRSLQLQQLSMLFATVTVVHYAVSYDRIKWLLQR